MNKLWNYLISNRKTIIMNIVLFVLLVLVFWLFELPLKVIGYLAIMWLFILLVIGSLDFIGFNRRMTILTQLDEENIPSTDYLPRNTIEKEYVRLLLEEYDRKRTLIETDESRYEDMVDYFTAWAHQIKTPIAALSLINEDMENDDERAKVKSEITDIEDYADMVLNFIRLGSDSKDLVLEKVDLDKVIKEVIRRFSVQFIGKGIGISYESHPFVVRTDEKWIRFVLGQLMSNALKYSNSGTITIKTEGNELALEDQGIGIKAEDLPRVFEKGYTGYTGRRFEKSTGIGLYLTKNACDMIGVDIKLESEKGAGTKAILAFAKEDIDVRD